jgi:hypothetical protein
MSPLETQRHTERTTVAWHFARGTAPFVWYPTYATNIPFVTCVVLIIRANVPAPLRYGVPMLDFDFHAVELCLFLCTRKTRASLN